MTMQKALWLTKPSILGKITCSHSSVFHLGLLPEHLCTVGTQGPRGEAGVVSDQVVPSQSSVLRGQGGDGARHKVSFAPYLSSFFGSVCLDQRLGLLS